LQKKRPARRDASFAVRDSGRRDGRGQAPGQARAAAGVGAGGTRRPAERFPAPAPGRAAAAIF